MWAPLDVSLSLVLSFSHPDSLSPAVISRIAGGRPLCHAAAHAKSLPRHLHRAPRSPDDATTPHPPCHLLLSAIHRHLQLVAYKRRPGAPRAFLSPQIGSPMSLASRPPSPERPPLLLRRFRKQPASF